MMQDYQLELVAIKDLLKKNPEGMSVTDISKALKKNKNTIGRYLDILLISGQVDMRTYGMAKVYTISQRVPLSTMLSYSKELIVVLDDAQRIIDINDNFLNVLQLSREDTLGKNISFLQSPEVDVHELLESITADGGKKETPITLPLRHNGERIFHQKSIPRNGIARCASVRRLVRIIVTVSGFNRRTPSDSPFLIISLANLM